MKTIAKSVIVSSLIILVANTVYVLLNTPPDGRWILQLPITSIFAAAYIIAIYFITKLVRLDDNKVYFAILFHALVALSFFVIGSTIERSFQDVDLLYINQYIAIAPYIILYTAGIILYTAMAKIFQGRK